ncbi:uncharacterized protein BO80DRAFT_226082 [Aspergillus ibericus CBS 121593]|uniref:Uncharacterized protein n=1 Tax=Aspergillus ibericus CBS 121593 TaxID=1448316 RepID=A0A395GLP0_9EURO|nr:hypothetical protein BO80DRAFT_226082 [Aspergillus ibericus CBS 121593]RAK96430.1 hypothetical protein BO80DRAFT_226082 [Aspergillus ibericus CBS 121593]
MWGSMKLSECSVSPPEPVDSQGCPSLYDISIKRQLRSGTVTRFLGVVGSCKQTSAPSLCVAHRSPWLSPNFWGTEDPTAKRTPILSSAVRMSHLCVHNWKPSCCLRLWCISDSFLGYSLHMLSGFRRFSSVPMFEELTIEEYTGLAVDPSRFREKADVEGCFTATSQ